MSAWSHSRLECAEECPRRHELRYLLRQPPRGRSVEAFAGERVHSLLERLYHHLRIHGGEPPGLPEALAQLDREWDAYLTSGVYAVRGSVADYRARARDCVAAYWRAAHPFADWRTTVGIEEDLRFDVAGVPFRAVLDRVERDGDDWAVHDYKTGSRAGDPRTSPQLTRYALALREARGADPARVRLALWHLPSGLRYESTRTASELDAEVARIAAAVARAEARHVHPPAPGPLCRWCEYLDRCPEGRAAR